MPAPFVTELTEISSGYVLAEAPVAASPSGVFFADVRAGGVLRADDDGTTRTVIEHRRGIGGMAAHAEGGFVVSGRNVAHKALDQTTTIIADRNEGAGRFIYNDLTTDRDGRVYVGSFATNAPFDRDDQGRTGALNVIDLDGRLRVLDEDVIAANGMSCSPDGRALYFVETGRRVLWRYEIVAPGRLGRKTAHHDFGGDSPDGMAVAEDGSLWVAMAGAGCVAVLDAAGTRLGEVVMPGPSVTSLCFGGTDRRTVYICTGGHGEGEATGAVYRARAAVPGTAMTPARIPLDSGGRP